MFVYLVTNLIDGKLYVGKTEKTVQERWDAHLANARKRKHQEYLYRAIRKHGPENFHVQCLAEAQSTEELNQLERSWILVLNTIAPHGYNMTFGGDGVPGTPEVCEKIRLKALERPPKSEQERKAIGLRFKGKPKSATHRAKIAAAWDDDHRERMSKRAKVINEIENAKLQDFTCPDCGTEFKQVTKGVYGGHRRFCLHYSGVYKVWLEWDGTVAEFAEKYGISRATVYNWKNERDFVEFK
jgi:group I intron endonuclease